MSSVKIRNIGPLINVNLELKRINIIMGPQSSGKSTIAKIVSFCQWVEKRYILDGKFEDDFEERFIDFHRISKSYFTKNSSFKYETEFLTISQKGINFSISIKQKDSNIKYKYKKSKNIFIPAERNFVSVIPNLGKYNETNDNIMNFLYDWFDAKQNYTSKKNLPILNLDVSYHYQKDSESDTLILKGKTKALLLKNASSGLQSVVPLVMLIDYLTDGFYLKSKPNSVIERAEVFNTLFHNFQSVVDHPGRINEIVNDANEKQRLILTKEEYERIFNLNNNIKNYSFTNFIIEEPEQNLFPLTQRDFIYYLFNKIGKADKSHTVLLTTHSPFILYAVNNCLMGETISPNMPDNEQQELNSYKSWITPKWVGIWQIENGINKSVIDERTGTVTKHYFNEIMAKLMDEYYEMLSYFTNDNKTEK